MRNSPSLTACSRLRLVAAMNAGVHFDRLRITQSFKLTFLKNPEKLRLQVQGQIANLIEENRALVGQFKAPDLPSQRACESAFLVPEQLTLNESRRQCWRS